MDLPWLNSRLYVFLFSLIDFIIFFIGARLFELYKYPSNYIKGNFIFFIIIFFIIIVNYISGRYTLENFNNKYKSFVCILIKSLSGIVILLISIHIAKYINLINENLFDQYKLLTFYIVFSNLAHYLTKISFLKQIKYANQWIFLGSKERYESLYFSIRNSGKLINIKLINDVFNEKELNDIKVKRVGIIFDDLHNLNEKEINLIFKLKTEGIEVMSIFKWCVFRLQSIPSNILNLEDILGGDFFLNKNSKSIRLKRLGDFTLSIFLLITLSPLLFIAIILIKLEDFGPIFYWQYRTGYRGKPFKVWKLRTMKVNSEVDGAVWSKKSDPRVTNIGRLLRKTRIDELPQLVAVVNGQMSLIGPRPERPEFNSILAKEIKYYELRHLIKPGLSGWSQVNYPYGASVKDSSMKLSYDLYYLYNFSNFLDFIIFFKTIKLVLNLRGSTPK